MCTASAAWEEPVGDAAHIAWARGAIDALTPWHDAGAYLNYLHPERPEAYAESFGGAQIDRLAGIKRRYDPGDVFRGQQGHRPAVGA